MGGLAARPLPAWSDTADETRRPVGRRSLEKAKAPPALATGPPSFFYACQYIRGLTFEEMPAVTGGGVD